MQQFVFFKEIQENPIKNEFFGTEIKNFILLTEIYDVRVPLYLKCFPILLKVYFGALFNSRN